MSVDSVWEDCFGYNSHDRWEKPSLRKIGGRLSPQLLCEEEGGLMRSRGGIWKPSQGRSPNLMKGSKRVSI